MGGGRYDERQGLWWGFVSVRVGMGSSLYTLYECDFVFTERIIFSVNLGLFEV